MFDVKILTAVFASLAATAVVINGGAADLDPDLDNGVEENIDQGLELYQLIEDPLEKIREQFRTYPEPENSIQAELEIQQLDQQEINIRNSGKLYIQDLEKVDIGSNQVTSEEPITLHGYQGKIQSGNTTQFEGNINQITSSKVNITGTTSFQQETNTTQIKLENVEKTPLKLENIAGNIESGDSSTEFNEPTRTIEINSYTGDITIQPGAETVKLDGKVHTLKAGTLTIEP